MQPILRIVPTYICKVFQLYFRRGLFYLPARVRVLECVGRYMLSTCLTSYEGWVMVYINRPIIYKSSPLDVLLFFKSIRTYLSFGRTSSSLLGSTFFSAQKCIYFLLASMNQHASFLWQNKSSRAAQASSKF